MAEPAIGVRITITNLDEFRRRLTPQLYAPAVRRFMTRVSLKIEAAAKAKVQGHRDTGQTQRGITHDIDQAEVPKWARVRSTYGPSIYLHGFFDTTATRSVPHWPPPGPLEAWARRHGMPVFVVQRSIAMKGTPLVPFLKEAAQEAEGDIPAQLEQAARDVGSEWKT